MKRNVYEREKEEREMWKERKDRKTERKDEVGVRNKEEKGEIKRKERLK